MCHWKGLGRKKKARVAWSTAGCLQCRLLLWAYLSPALILPLVFLSAPPETTANRCNDFPINHMQKQECVYSRKAGSTISSSDGTWVASPLPSGLTFRGHPSAAHLAAMPWLHSSLCLPFDTHEGFCLSIFHVTRHRELPSPTSQPSQTDSPPKTQHLGQVNSQSLS